MKKVWFWMKIIYGFTFIFSVVLLVIILGFLMSNILADKQALVNTATINSITLIMGLVSLPGVLVQLLSLLEINQKKTYTLEQKCPKCKHLVDFKLTEDT
ncbi:hypothetical protein D3C74_347510 [compost metagenome]